MDSIYLGIVCKVIIVVLHYCRVDTKGRIKHGIICISNRYFMSLKGYFTDLH